MFIRIKLDKSGSYQKKREKRNQWRGKCYSEGDAKNDEKKINALVF
jgi:hypothetical protein